MDEVAGAIADPVRREILAMLRGGRLPAGKIADRFPVSRPAVSRHLRVLRDSGLVHDELTGRQRFYRLDPAPLAGLAEWLAPFVTGAGRPEEAGGEAGAWERRFDALETEVHRTRRERRARSGSRAAANTAEREERSA